MNKSKIYMIVSICILFLCVVGSTTAYYIGVVYSTDVSTITYGLDYYINYEKGQSLTSATLDMSSDYTGGNSTDVKLWKKDNTYDIYGQIYLDINDIGEDLSNLPALKYVVLNNDTVIAEGSLAGSSTGDSVLIKSNIPLELTEQLYTVYIWLDINEVFDSSIEYESLSVTVRCEATMVPIDTPTNLVQLITHVYNRTTKVRVYNNNIEYIYAENASLMNDRHDTSGNLLDNLNGGNIRYYGKNPDNYIYFNCDDYSNQSSDTCELWRIIGVFDGKIKIIRNSALTGRYAYDFDYNNDLASKTSSNSWENSSLNNLLNNYYYNNEDTTYYNENSDGTIVSVSASFNTNGEGIKNDETRNMIKESTWNLGGYNIAELYPNDIYTYERGTLISGNSSATWQGKIALMYPSDYGYATDFNVCSEKLNTYNNSDNSYGCRANDWLYISSYNQWTMTPTSDSTNGIWGIVSSGFVTYYASIDINKYGVRPVLYLDSELTTKVGDGTSSNPYRILVD